VTSVPASPTSPFGRHELPYGIFSTPDREPRVGVAVESTVLDLAAALTAAGRDATVFRQPTLNAFLAQGSAAWAEVRALLQDLVGPGRAAALQPHLVDATDVTMHLPFAVADYVDFYASEHHARNLGAILRPGQEPLPANWRHLPVGYHGRAGTVVVSGTEVPRPYGQHKRPDETAPSFGPSRRLDFEAELGWVVGVGSRRGAPIGVTEFADHVFGVVVLNDWSARDLQAWEYVPLGPFLGKSFATSVSAWVLPLAALAVAAVPLPRQEPVLLDYLRGPSVGYAVDVEVELNGDHLSTCPYASMYYSPAQMLAHLTSNGASARTGDLLGSGTISGPEPGQRGSLIELSGNGTEPLQLSGGTRVFLEDGDTVVLRASAPGPGGRRIRLGEVAGRVVPARPA